MSETDNNLARDQRVSNDEDQDSTPQTSHDNTNNEQKTPQTEHIPGARLLVLNNNGVYQPARLIHKLDDGSLYVNMFGSTMTRIPFSQIKNNPSMIQFDSKYYTQDILTYPLTPEMQESIDKLVEEGDYVKIAKQFWTGMIDPGPSSIDENARQTFVIDLNKTIEYLNISFDNIRGTDNEESFMKVQNNCGLRELYTACFASYYLGIIYLRCFEDYAKAEEYFNVVIYIVPHIVGGMSFASIVEAFESIAYQCAFTAQCMVRNNDKIANCDEKEVYYVRQCLKFQNNDGSGLTSLGVCLLKQKCTIIKNKKIITYKVSNENKNNNNNDDDEDNVNSDEKKKDYKVIVDNTYSEAFHCFRHSYHQEKSKGTNQFLALCHFKGLGCKVSFKKCNNIHLKYVDNDNDNNNTNKNNILKDIKDKNDNNNENNKSQCSKLWLTMQSIVFPNGFKTKRLKQSNVKSLEKREFEWQHPLRDDIYDKLMYCLYNYCDKNLYYGNYIKIIEFQTFENSQSIRLNTNSREKEKMEQADCMLISLLIVIGLFGFLETDTCGYKQFKLFLFDKCFKHPSVADIANSTFKTDSRVADHLLWLGEWMFGFFQHRTKAIQKFNANIIDPIIDLIFEYELAIIINPNVLK